jgi:hypothetical protein
VTNAQRPPAALGPTHLTSAAGVFRGAKRPRAAAFLLRLKARSEADVVWADTAAMGTTRPWRQTTPPSRAAAMVAMSALSVLAYARAASAQAAPTCVRTICHEVNCTDGMLLGCTCYATADEATSVVQGSRKSGLNNAVSLVSRCDGQASTVGRVCCIIAKRPVVGETCDCSLVYGDNDCGVLERAGEGRVVNSCAGAGAANAADVGGARKTATAATASGERRGTRGQPRSPRQASNAAAGRNAPAGGGRGAAPAGDSDLVQAQKARVAQSVSDINQNVDNALEGSGSYQRSGRQRELAAMGDTQSSLDDMDDAPPPPKKTAPDKSPDKSPDKNSPEKNPPAICGAVQQWSTPRSFGGCREFRFSIQNDLGRPRGCQRIFRVQADRTELGTHAWPSNLQVRATVGLDTKIEVPVSASFTFSEGAASQQQLADPFAHTTTDGTESGTVSDITFDGALITEDECNNGSPKDKSGAPCRNGAFYGKVTTTCP